VTISNDGQPADTVLVTETLTGATGFVSTAAGYALASMSLAIPRSPSPV
jgi:hypothetical protein